MLKKIKDSIKGKDRLFKRRSSQWPAVRKDFISLNPYCAACGKAENLEVHHIIPYHEAPELELDPDNLISLCDQPGPDNCHLNVGHLGDFHQKNPNVRADAHRILASISKDK